MKSKTYNWIWKWHFIGGLVSFPIIFILALTGAIYLFKDYYEEPMYDSVKNVEVGEHSLTYQKQWELILQKWDQNPNTMILPQSIDQSTEFTAGKFANKSSLFINPYTGEITGEITSKNTDMHKIRKFHGELLMGGFGTKIVELVGSWMIVLILTGLFLFFPRKWRDFKKLFTIRMKSTKEALYRDLHMVTGFWFSIILLIILAGGLPWTDVFGDGFKWVQKQTNTGYPSTWQGKGLASAIGTNPVSLDRIVANAQALDLPGEVTITLPKSKKGVFGVSNIYSKNQSAQVAIFFDQYTGAQMLAHKWEDVGFLMKGRMWAMAFHQGEFGLWNWILVLLTASMLMLLSLSAILSYFIRKKPGSWGFSKKTYKVHYGLYILLLVLGVLLPMFGISIVLIWGYERINQIRLSRLQQKDVLAS